MARSLWKASADIIDIIEEVRTLHHLPRLEKASIAVCFDNSKPFVKNKLNLGKVTKFSPLSRLWQGQPHDFCLIIPADLWQDILKGEQRVAYLDFLLTRCQVEYIPETIEENGKKKVIKDEWGRIQYTAEIKKDDEGNPKWVVAPVDIEVFAQNLRRYGLWTDVLLELKEAIAAAPENGNV